MWISCRRGKDGSNGCDQKMESPLFFSSLVINDSQCIIGYDETKIKEILKP